MSERTVADDTLDTGRVHHVLGSHRLGRADVLGDHGVEDGRLAGVEPSGVGGAVLGSAVVGGGHWCPVRARRSLRPVRPGSAMPRVGTPL